MPSDENGWVRYPDADSDVPPSLRINPSVDRADELADERRAAALRAELGFEAVVAGQPAEISVAIAPLSGHILRWRSDGFCQSFGDDDVVDDDGWEPWGYSLDDYESRYETPPGDSSTPTWWMCTGEALPTANIAAWLADDSDVPVIRLGGLWLVEYVSTPTTVFIDIDGELIEHRPRRHAFHRPAEFPYPSHAPNPRAT